MEWSYKGELKKGKILKLTYYIYLVWGEGARCVCVCVGECVRKVTLTV